MDKVKRLILVIILLVALVIILLSIILFRISGNSKKRAMTYNEDDTEDNYIISKLLERGVTWNRLVTVESCLQKYYNLLNTENSIYYGRDENDDYTKIVSDEEIYKNILDLLNEEFITSNNITEKNLKNYIHLMNKKAIIQPLKIKNIVDENYEKYAVYGIVMDNDYKYIDEFYLYVILNIEESTFCIEPCNKKYNNFEDIELKLENVIIKKNDNNEYKDIYLEFQKIAQYYHNMYKRLALSSPEICYEYLDEEYRNARFGSLENFKTYIQKNRQKILSTRLEKYNSKEDYENYNQYICVDQNEKYYIFREKAVLDYSIILDTYTIDLPEFLEEYNSASDSEKVTFNIQKLVASLNDEDYKYIYNKLNRTFRNNNYKTQAEFESFIKQNLYESNKLVSGNYEIDGDVYICTLTLSDSTGKQAGSKKIQILMRLKEGTDFEVSFNMN